MARGTADGLTFFKLTSSPVVRPARAMGDGYNPDSLFQLCIEHDVRETPQHEEPQTGCLVSRSNLWSLLNPLNRSFYCGLQIQAKSCLLLFVEGDSLIQFSPGLAVDDDRLQEYFFLSSANT